jgi:hypothetical protein
MTNKMPPTENHERTYRAEEFMSTELLNTTFTLRDGETIIFPVSDLYQYRVEDGKLCWHAVTSACVSRSVPSSMHLGRETNIVINYAYSVDVPGRPQSVFDAELHGNDKKGCLCEGPYDVKCCTILGYGPGDERDKFEPMAAERWENLEAARLKKEKARTYSREYQRRRKEKERQEPQNRQDLQKREPFNSKRQAWQMAQERQKRQNLASLREVVLGESAAESMLLKSVVANNMRRVIDTTSS